MFFALPLAFFIAKLIDIHGAFGVPGTGESLPGVFYLTSHPSYILLSGITIWIPIVMVWMNSRRLRRPRHLRPDGAGSTARVVRIPFRP